PYEFNPANIDPLKDIITETIDFACLRACRSIKLYISATNVRTGRLRIFKSSELSADVLLASACLPHIRRAVEINGEHYWDGGFMGNPILEPLIGHCRGCCDIVIVQVNSTRCDEVPRTANEIINRVNEISFNSSLMREIRAIAGVMMLVNSGAMEIKDPQYKCTLFHRIAAEDVMKGLKAGSKLDISWPFLTRLKNLGRERAGQWLGENFEHIGHASTLDLQAWEPAYH
ncbi:MAG: patatin-like phospholipase family protein, partial [Betaproteobacteria bacterium]|nr:patatin-like phospholipase family protein [Betaproteobacteria bacterium]